MNTVIYTQRVENISAYDERRDAADQRLAKFLTDCGYLPVPMPNLPKIVPDFLRTLNPFGILLTGGNDLACYGGDAPERDETEQKIIAWAIDKRVPIFGICRGMQFLANYFGATLLQTDGHVRTRHAVTGKINRPSVNSYHTWAIGQIPNELAVIAYALDGVIEGICHQDLPLMAVGWHPEREDNLSSEDINLVRIFFERNSK